MFMMKEDEGFSLGSGGENRPVDCPAGGLTAGSSLAQGREVRSPPSVASGKALRENPNPRRKPQWGIPGGGIPNAYLIEQGHSCSVSRLDT